MSGRQHRPFADLTWPQLEAVRDAAHGRFPKDTRAVWALTKKSVPLIVIDRKGTALTEAGKEIWTRMQDWRPDLYRSAT